MSSKTIENKFRKSQSEKSESFEGKAFTGSRSGSQDSIGSDETPEKQEVPKIEIQQSKKVPNQGLLMAKSVKTVLSDQSNRDIRNSLNQINTEFSNKLIMQSSRRLSSTIERNEEEDCESPTKLNDNEILEVIKRNEQVLSENTNHAMVGKSKRKIGKNILNMITEENCHGHASRICMIDPEERKPYDIEVLVKATSFLMFFKNMNKKKAFIEFNCQVKCCKWLYSKSYAQGAGVITFGAAPDNFYIILRGTVGIYIPRPFEKRDFDLKVMTLLVQLTKGKKNDFNYKAYATPENGFTDDMIAVALTFAKIKDKYITYTDEFLAKIFGPKFWGNNFGARVLRL